jgi:hypothetical protein
MVKPHKRHASGVGHGFMPKDSLPSPCRFVKNWHIWPNKAEASSNANLLLLRLQYSKRATASVKCTIISSINEKANRQHAGKANMPTCQVGIAPGPRFNVWKEQGSMTSEAFQTDLSVNISAEKSASKHEYECKRGRVLLSV